MGIPSDKENFGNGRWNGARHKVQIKLSTKYTLIRNKWFFYFVESEFESICDKIANTNDVTRYLEISNMKITFV